jgi:hypothetical protein
MKSLILLIMTAALLSAEQGLSKTDLELGASKIEVSIINGEKGWRVKVTNNSDRILRLHGPSDPPWGVMPWFDWEIDGKRAFYASMWSYTGSGWSQVKVDVLQGQSIEFNLLELNHSFHFERIDSETADRRMVPAIKPGHVHTIRAIPNHRWPSGFEYISKTYSYTGLVGNKKRKE